MELQDKVSNTQVNVAVLHRVLIIVCDLLLLSYCSYYEISIHNDTKICI